MTVAEIDDLLAHAQECFEKAREAATAIRLATFNESIKYAKSYGASMLADEPGYSEIEPFYGIKGWAAILCFDLRKSTPRAMEIGPRDTFITMHTYMPTMLALVGGAQGKVVGLRGDGAIAAFGIVDLTDPSVRVTKKQGNDAVSKACDCGHAMVMAINKIVNPVLVKGDVKGGLQIGVGIDVGGIVATNIGLGSAHELTAYGNAVNTSCKRSYGNDEVILTNQARLWFPTKPGGRTKFNKYPGKTDAYILKYPPNYKTLAD